MSELEPTPEIGQERVRHLRGADMVVYRALISLLGRPILSVPSKPDKPLKFLSKDIPYSSGISGPINRVSNALKKKRG